MTFKEYRNNEDFKEEPTEIYISSSMEESHWLYKTAIEARDGLKITALFLLPLIIL